MAGSLENINGESIGWIGLRVQWSLALTPPVDRLSSLRVVLKITYDALEYPIPSTPICPIPFLGHSSLWTSQSIADSQRHLIGLACFGDLLHDAT